MVCKLSLHIQLEKENVLTCFKVTALNYFKGALRKIFSYINHFVYFNSFTSET